MKIKYGDFTQITRSITQRKVLRKKDDILPLAKQLLGVIEYSFDHPIRLMGLSVSKPSENDIDESDPEWIEGFLDFKD